MSLFVFSHHALVHTPDDVYISRTAALSTPKNSTLHPVVHTPDLSASKIGTDRYHEPTF